MGPLTPRLALAVLAALVLLALWSPSAFAVDKTWDGGAGTVQWNDGNNWNPNGVPGADDDVTLSSGNSVRLENGADSTIDSLTQGGSLVVDTRTLTVDAGPSSITGQVTIEDGGVLNFLGNTSVDGANGRFTVNANSTLHNQGTMTWKTGAGFNAGIGDGTFRNGSTLNHEGGTHDFNIASIENVGTVNVQGGDMALRGNSSGPTFTGDWILTAGAKLGFDQGSYTMGNGASVTGAGEFNLRDSVFGDPTVVVPVGASVSTPTRLVEGILQVDSNNTLPSLIQGQFSTLRGSGDLTVQSFDWQGTQEGTGSTVVPTGGTLTMPNAIKNLNRRLRTEVNVTWTSANGFMDIGAPGVLENAAALTFPDDHDIFGSGVVRNVAGATLQKTGGTAGNTSDIPNVENAGTVAVTQSELRALNSFTQTAGNTTVAAGTTLGSAVTLTGGQLTGSGTVDGDLTNQGGNVAPGSTPGTLNVTGVFAQGPGGTLDIEVNGTTPGTQFDVLAVTGPVNLDGTVNVTTAPGFDPAPTDTFQFLISQQSQQGTFSTLTGANLPSGKTYALDYPTAFPPGAQLVLNAAPPPPPPGGGGPAPPTTPPAAAGAAPAAPAATPQCGDGKDNDSDGAIDRQDPGCFSGGSAPNPADNNEADESVRDLALCGRDVRLVRADVKGRSVVLNGFVANRLVGRPVSIFANYGRARSGEFTRLTTVRPTADGNFTARVMRPPPRLFEKARFTAVVARARSVALKLPQSLASSSARQVGGSIELRGQVKRNLLGKRNPVVVKRLVCGRFQTVGQARPDRRGRYTVRFPAPQLAEGVFYRAESMVLAKPGSKRHVKQFARAIGLTL